MKIQTMTHRLLHSINHDKNMRIATLGLSFAIIFVGINILAETNPFGLFWPGGSYPIPRHNSRKPVEVHVVERDTGKAIPTKRFLLSDENQQAMIRRLAMLITAPNELRVDHAGENDYTNTEPMPELGMSIRKIWFIDDTLFIDLREKSLLEEPERFMENRKTIENKDVNYYLDAYFHALTPSLFSIFPDVQKIQYLVDGNPGGIRGMNFDLKELQIRNP